MLMILTSCVYVQGKKKIRDAACLLPSLARSLLLPLFCSLPAFANIGFKPAQNSAQRKAAAVAAAEAVASPAAETPQPQDVPPCLLDHLLRDNRPALHPRHRLMSALSLLVCTRTLVPSSLHSFPLILVAHSNHCRSARAQRRCHLPQSYGQRDGPAGGERHPQVGSCTSAGD
uniref:Opioid binding protein/cell adhesion molecule like n=2 Tax=Rousettus aegyptiacus TaxID=9407 RepID=A0A7J8H4C0_ROUAE|nr:opioid binding protein/cell adhesion molecule like [Rousettus aegyptiacus]